MTEKTGKTGKRIVVALLTAVVTWLFLCVDPNAVYPNIYAQPGSGAVVTAVTVLQRIGAVFGDFSVLSELLFIALFIVIYKCGDRVKKCPVIFRIMCLLMTCLYLASESFRDTDSMAFVFGDPFVFMLSLLRGAGLFILLSAAVSYVVSFIDSHGFEKNDSKWNFVKILVILFILWFPILISVFPGGYSIDVQIQLREFFGYEPFSDAHPPFFTLLEGVCVSLGNAIGHPTVGLFLFTVLQFAFVLLSMTYALNETIKMSGSNLFGWFAVLFVGLNTIFSFNAAYIGRDASYSAGMFVMAVACVKILKNRANGKGFKKSAGAAVLFAVFGLLVSLMRHNGIYTVIAMSVLMAVLLLCKSKDFKASAGLTGILVSSVVLFYVITKAVYPAMGVDSSKGSLLYVNMLQHTVRIDSAYPEELGESEKETIGKLIDLDQVEKRYTPKTSDGIKFITDLEADPVLVKEYEKIWFKQVLKHPFTALASAYNMSYGFWAPVEENTINDFGSWYYESDYPELDFKIPFFFSALRNLCESFLHVWTVLPFVRLLHIPGLYTWLFVFAVFYILYKKDFIRLTAFIPGFLTVAAFLFVPSFYGHPRYVFPIIYTMVLYVCLCFCISQNREDGLELGGEKQ